MRVWYSISFPGVLPLFVAMIVASSIRMQAVAGFGAIIAILFYATKYISAKGETAKTRLPVMFHATPFRTTVEKDVETNGLSAVSVVFILS